MTRYRYHCIIGRRWKMDDQISMHTVWQLLNRILLLLLGWMRICVCDISNVYVIPHSPDVQRQPPSSAQQCYIHGLTDDMWPGWFSDEETFTSGMAIGFFYLLRSKPDVGEMTGKQHVIISLCNFNFNSSIAIGNIYLCVCVNTLEIKRQGNDTVFHISSEISFMCSFRHYFRM